MKRPLMRHQRHALKYARKHRSPAFLMEMRLGKTLVCIRYAQRKGFRCILVMAPKSALISWREELTREGELFHTIEGAKAHRLREACDLLQRVRGQASVRVWFLIGYETLRQTPELTRKNWDWLVADESTRLKNTGALTTRIVNGYKISGVDNPGFRRRIPRTILSGLVAPESPMEVYEQFYFLDGEFMGFKDIWRFRASLFRRDFTGYGWVPKTGARERIKKAVHQRAFVLTRKDAGMGKKAVREVREVEPSPKLWKMYKEAETEFELGEYKTNWKIVVQIWLSRLAGGFDLDLQLISRHKIDELMNLLEEELQGQQVVVWFHFRAEMAAVSETLRKAGIKYGEIKGGQSLQDRMDVVAQFRRGRLRVVLGQIDCGRFSLDLSSADTAIYFSNSYSAEGRFQSEDRIVHPKKDRPLLYIDLVTKGTVDMDCVKALGSKRVHGKMFMRRFKEAFLRRRRNNG